MKKQKTFGMNIGASSILVIIVILTLVCFAGISLASANADYQLCQKLVKRTTAYYEATSAAYEDIAAKKASSAGTDNAFSDSYTINDNQSLKIVVDLNPSDGSNYSIKSFKIVTDQEPIDDSLSLLLD